LHACFLRPRQRGPAASSGERLSLPRVCVGDCTEVSTLWFSVLWQDELYSCRAGDLAKFCDRLKQDPQLHLAKDSLGNTALHWFAFRNHREGVLKTLSLGALIDAQALNLQTPLMWATVKVQYR
jgi:hypothetical protein